MKYLFIYPHPDDETFFSGGIIQHLIKKDNEVELIILSKGEASTLRTGLADNEDLASVREKELTKVCNFLGLSKLIMKDFPDSKFENTEQDISSFLSTYIKDNKPDKIVTFEPFGAYGHSDHICTSKIVTSLVDKKQLIYATIDPDFKFDESTRKMNKSTISGPTNPNYIYKLSPLEYFRKLKAMSLYKSQTNEKNTILHLVKALLVMRYEYFVVFGEKLLFN